jgi:methionyl-tRNA formyltransferase
MKVVFMGTPDFAVPTLEAIHRAGHQVTAVLCQPDRPSGRGLKLVAGPVKRKAQELGIPVHQPAKIRSPEAMQALRDAAPDVSVVAAYGKILPKDVLELPPHGSINVHASLLPRLRGAAPIHHAVLQGERTSGVTIMLMDEGMDTGAMLLVEEFPLAPRETAGSLHDKLAAVGARLIVDALDRLAKGTLERVPQDHTKATYAPKLESDLGRIDWTRDAAAVDRHVRGVTPFPGAFTFLEGKRLRVTAAEPAAGSGAAGTVLSAGGTDGLVVACGSGALRLLEVQPEGKKPQAASAFLAGRKIPVGTKIGAEPGPVS